MSPIYSIDQDKLQGRPKSKIFLKILGGNEKIPPFSRRAYYEELRRVNIRSEIENPVLFHPNDLGA